MRKYLTAFASAIVSALIALLAWKEKVFFAVDSLSIAQNHSWGHFPLVNRFTNQFVNWQSAAPFEILLLSANPGVYFAVLLAVFSAGLCLLVLSSDQQTPKKFGFLFAVAISATSILLLGLDAVVLGSLVWLPWFVLQLKNCARNFNTGNQLLVLIFGLLLLWSAGPLALLLILVAWLSLPETAGERLPKVLLLIIGAAALVTWAAPYPTFPDYPPYARVLVARPLLSRIDPLIGAAPPLESVARDFLDSALFPWILFIVVLTLIVAWQRKSESRLASVALALAAIAVLIDVAPISNSIKQLGPLYSLGRIIPQLHLFALTSVGAILLLILGAQSVRGPRLRLFSVGLGTLLLLLVIQKGKTGALYRELSHDLVAPALAASAHLNASTERVFLSPSQLLVSQFGSDHVLGPDSSLHASSLCDIGVTISTSIGRKGTKHLHCPKPTGRWTTRSAGQTGKEWVHLQFHQDQKLSGLVLGLGTYSADFPRGIEILGTQSCDGSVDKFVDYISLWRENPWPGPLRITPGGYPYLGHESDITIRFEKETSVRCLLIRQIGSDPHFDWSIYAINLLRKIS